MMIQNVWSLHFEQFIHKLMLQLAHVLGIVVCNHEQKLSILFHWRWDEFCMCHSASIACETRVARLERNKRKQREKANRHMAKACGVYAFLLLCASSLRGRWMESSSDLCPFFNVGRNNEFAFSVWISTISTTTATLATVLTGTFSSR